MAEPDETYDVMISYAWEHKEKVLKIREKLKEHKIRCWIDVENMSGSILEAMSAAVENSTIFLMCYSEKYSESENCQAEAEYARKLKKPTIPCKMQQGYDAKGWLGFIIGTKLFFDFSGKYPFENKMEELLREIQTQLGQDSPENLIKEDPKPKDVKKEPESRKIIDGIVVPNDVTGLRHIAFLPPDNFWIGFDNKIFLIDKSGNKLKEIQRFRFTFGAHSMTEDGCLVFLTGISVKKYTSESVSENLITGTNVEGWKARSIYASHRNGDIIIGLQNEEKGIGKIARYDKMGEHKQTVECDAKDKPLYTWPRYVTENYNSDIVISDWYGGVVVTTHDGNHRFTYSIAIPRAVVTDSKGRIIVCNNTPKMHVIDQNGKFLSYILTGAKDSFSLYLHQDTELYVGFNAQKKITVYRV